MMVISMFVLFQFQIDVRRRVHLGDPLGEFAVENGTVRATRPAPVEGTGGV